MCLLLTSPAPSCYLCSSVMSDSLQPMDCSITGFPVLHHLQELLKLMSIESVTPFNHLILSSPSPAFNLSQHQGISNESALCIRWPKYWSFIISPSNEYSGLIFFRIDWFDLLAIHGTLKSLLQKHQFFGAQLSSQSNSHIHTLLLEKP